MHFVYNYFASLVGSKYAVVGPACNEGTVVTAAITSNNFHLVQVSYSANTPELSDTGRYPMFYRTVASYLNYLATIASIMNHFDWLHVGVIHVESTFYTTALESLNHYFQSSVAGARILATQGLSSLLDFDRTSIPTEVRIFIVLAPEQMAHAIMCAAYRLGMTGSRYQWILLGNYEVDWWKQRIVLSPVFHEKIYCLEQDLQGAIESTLILTQELKFEGMSASSEIIQGGLTREEFWTEFIAFFNLSDFDFELATHVPSTYDAVWSIALALNLSLATNNSVRLNSAMEMSDFQGASGRIRFTSSQHSHNPPATRIAQMQSGKMVFVGLHYENNDTLNLNNSLLRWQSASGPPRDRPKVSLETVEISIVGIMLVFVSVGIVLCVVMAVVNCYYRKHKVIKASSPYINLLIIIGCLMGFASVVFISIENIDFHLHITPKAYPFLCNIRPWLLSLGYTLAFGALFAKTWRIYRIFKNPWKQNRPLQDHVLIAIVGVLLGIDVLVLILWLTIDPLDIYAFVVDTDVESFTQELHLVCSDSNVLDITGADFTIWIIFIMIMKGSLLLFGLFLVSQTMKIKAEVFQDAKYTGIAIYGVGMCCAIGVPLAMFLMYYMEEDVGYFVATATITFCSYLILFMVFIPKIILLRKYRVKVPTSVLLGLNPSFRVRSRARYLANKNLKGKSHRTTLKEVTEHRSTDSMPNTGSQSSDNLLRLTSDEDVTGSKILDGWEASVESKGTDEKTVQTCEREIEFEGVSYIASVVIERELDSSSSSEQDCGRTSELHTGTVLVSDDEEPCYVKYQQERTVLTGDHHPCDCSSTLRACNHFSVEYTTTCVAEVHEE